jgi:DDE family transposase
LGRLVSSEGRHLCVRRLGGSRAGEIQLTRFLRNEDVTPQEMLRTAAERTAQRCVGRHVLAIQDTTVLRSAGGGGEYLHVVLAVDAEDGAILGLIDARFLERGQGRRAARKSLPIEEKESFRWLEGADEAASVCAGAACITTISDRESDIFEAFALKPQETELVVRAAHNRSLEDGGALFAAIDACPVVAYAEMELPAKPGRKARTAKLALRYKAVSLARPKTSLRAGLPKSVTVNLVDVREVDPPRGEKPIHWRLLTTHAVTCAGEAWAVIELYRRRWNIEQLFRTLKTDGFDIEHVDIEDAAPRNCLIAATLIATVCIQQLVHARDGGPGPLRPLTDAFDPEDAALLEACCATLEGKTQRQKNPHPKGSLAYAAWVCARLGGWTGYYGKPGPIVMREGWLEFQSMKRGARLIGAYK